MDASPTRSRAAQRPWHCRWLRYLSPPFPPNTSYPRAAYRTAWVCSNDRGMLLGVGRPLVAAPAAAPNERGAPSAPPHLAIVHTERTRADCLAVGDKHN